ncbi:MAG: TIGR01777 family oxidoreductase [Phycisphaerales bacterium JB063]
MDSEPAAARPPKRIAVSGATGLIGSALCEALRERGDMPCPIVRSAKGQAGEVLWDTRAQTFDTRALSACDAVVHLAGEGIVGRWTPDKKQRVRDSRVDGTHALSTALAGMTDGPGTLICASAIGYYGDTGQSAARAEDDPPGDDFLADVCVAWEAAANPAREAGLRVVHTRVGIVLSPKGGALDAMLTPFKLGVGGPLGNGRQWMSWIALADMVRVLLYAIDTPTLRGSVNAVAPEPVTNRAFTKTLGKVLGRPTLLPVPSFAPKLLYGKEAAEALVLGSIRVVPKCLLDVGFAFAYPTLEAALRHELGR